ncbi:mechanosensitive ion channel family protein [Tessaracoccus sp. OS52]|uniref:mechanosensitive ion channel family protein n=1 Tax=Tessaracoccus sp. OS52 TaxID=2886691 RepID=UPI001D115DDE|nr:mechanosensitive ion channel family protein [Tessaracoccus sp. OS52]MCC2594217.1 mechanosensitive ion channel family protein [Tessaracoccus sp. OS52]
MPAEILERALLVLVVVIAAVALRVFLRFFIRRVTRSLLAKGPDKNRSDLGGKAQILLARASGMALERHRQRVQTLGSLLGNIVDVVVTLVGILTILAIIGIPMTPLLASAGIGGLAIGFGAQSLVKDYLSGIFMLAEDQFGIGDLIQIDEIKGTVLEVNLRITKVRDPGGTVWYIRNGEILTLGNESQGFSTAFVDVPVAIDENPEKVTSVLRGAIAGMSEEPEWSEVLLEEPSVLGVDSMVGGTMTLKIMLKASPNNQWGPMREIRLRAQRACADAGIRGPILPGVPGLSGAPGTNGPTAG